MQEPWQQRLGYLGETETARAIIAGEYEFPKNSDPYVYRMLKNTQRRKGLSVYDGRTSIEQYKKVWKKTKEKTSHKPIFFLSMN